MVYTSPRSMIVPRGQFNPWAPAGKSLYFDNCTEYGCFNVRGPTYLTSREKIPAQPSCMELVMGEWLPNDPPIRNIATHPDHFIQREHVCGSRKPFLFVVNMMVPSIGNAVFTFRRRPDVDPDPVFERMLEQFMNASSDDYRNQRLKIIPGVPEGSWVAKRAVGNKPALIGKILTTYYRGENWYECCVDVGSSKIAGAMMGSIKSFAATLTLQLGFLIESQAEDELPERMLGGITIVQPQMTPSPQLRTSHSFLMSPLGQAKSLVTEVVAKVRGNSEVNRSR